MLYAPNIDVVVINPRSAIFKVKYVPVRMDITITLTRLYNTVKRHKNRMFPVQPQSG